MRGWYRVNIRQINVYLRKTFFSPIAIISSRNTQNYSHQYYNPLWLQIALNFFSPPFMTNLHSECAGAWRDWIHFFKNHDKSYAFWGKNKSFLFKSWSLISVWYLYSPGHKFATVPCRFLWSLYAINVTFSNFQQLRWIFHSASVDFCLMSSFSNSSLSKTHPINFSTYDVPDAKYCWNYMNELRFNSINHVLKIP